MVPFGSRKILTGVVARLHTNPPVEYEAKYVMEVLDDIPAINNHQLQLIQWIASYYMCTQGEVLNIGLPSGLKLSSESKIQLHPNFSPIENEQRLTDHEERVIGSLDGGKELDYNAIRDLLQIDNVHTIVKSLIQKEAIIIYEEIREKYKPKIEKRVRLTTLFTPEDKLEELVNGLESKPKQQQVILKFLQDVPVLENKSSNELGLAKSAFAEAALSQSSLKTLLKAGVLEEFEVTVDRIEHFEEETTNVELTGTQRQAFDSILASLQKHDAALLHGITGSGKTEIYIELIKETISNGNQALYLLPEIALTTQIVSRLRTVFGDQMGVYHSKFSDNERVELWKGLQQGRFNFIVGVRSSVFLPFDNLALIIVDEEHDSSYKQHDPAPRYNARDVAQVMAGIHHAKVVMGSATPALETAFLAATDKFGLVTLQERYGSAILPKIELVDALKAKKTKSMHGEFSEHLLTAIRETIANGQQVIIFQNRRGYAPYVSCDQCAWVPHCENCSVSLTYHLYKNELRCHYCGFKQKVPVACSACGSEEIQTVSYGTEKLEEELQLMLPEANVQRMDLDTTRKKLSYQRIISDFEEGNTDILVGTQMVTKGLDFGKVTLVGILDIDRMMHFPDFRSYERTFQLATQVSGRAGRRGNEGKVIIQTNNQNHPFFKLVASHNYAEFYAKEIVERQKFVYPPFARLIRIIVKDPDRDACQLTADSFQKRLVAAMGKRRVIGPQEPLVSKIRNQFIMEIFIKLERDRTNLTKAKEILAEEARSLLTLKQHRKSRVIFDVDPI